MTRGENLARLLLIAAIVCFAVSFAATVSWIEVDNRDAWTIGGLLALAGSLFP